MRGPRSRRPAALAVTSLTAVLLAGCGAAANSGTPPPATAPASTPSAATTTESIAPTLAPTPVPSDGSTAGQERTDASGITQVWVPAGTFTMGSDDTTLTPPVWAKDEAAAERPAHEVAISQGFWIDRTEATNAAFKAFADAGGYTNRGLWSEKGWTWLGLQNPASLPKPCAGEGADLPRACITWFEAEAYAKWRGGSLPTEAQWEFAARGPESRVYPWGDAWDPAKANVVVRLTALAWAPHWVDDRGESMPAW